MIITINTINHDDQRYPTVGDWRYDKYGNLDIMVSDMNNEDFEFLVGLHELVEAHLCKRRGITDEIVTKFDTEYEDARCEGDDESEPGDEPSAPYQNEHCIATGIERIVAAALGIKWAVYESAVQSL